MPVQPIVNIDDGAIEKKLRKLAKQTGVSMQFICWDQLRLWTQSMLRKTGPQKLSQGRFTVAEGVAELFRPVETPQALEFWKQRLAKEGNSLITYTNRGKMRLNRSQVKAHSVSEMKRIHKAARTSKGGVSKRKVQRQPNLAFDGEFLVAQSEYRKFLRMKQAQVGFLKAGWVPALEFWAQKSRAAASVPSWVQRHANKQGYPAGKIDENGNGFVAAINSVAYANRRISQDRLVEITGAARQRDLTRGAFKRMDQLADRFNAGAI